MRAQLVCSKHGDDCSNDQMNSYRWSTVKPGHEGGANYNPHKFTFLNDDANSLMHRNKRKVRRYIFEGEDNSEAIEEYNREMEKEKVEMQLKSEQEQLVKNNQDIMSVSSVNSGSSLGGSSLSSI